METLSLSRADRLIHAVLQPPRRRARFSRLEQTNIHGKRIVKTIGKQIETRVINKLTGILNQTTSDVIKLKTQ
jgi:hypothetical protein